MSQRKPPTERIRGRALQTIRRRYLAENPLCVHCEKQGRSRIATEVDHIEPLYKGGSESDDNRQGLCMSCHEAKTLKDMGHKVKRRFGPDGFPL
jgi:5-methylcytosine-specific restriction protein A